MELIKEMEAYAKENSVPIMETEGIEFLCSFVHEHKIKRILEIGTAIGYSAIRMALIAEDIEVVSIERDEQRYQIALENIHKAGLSNRIHLYHEDALNCVVEGMFDMIFIDAAKAQYLKFFQRYEPQLHYGGWILSDNLQFHGFVEHPEIIRSRHLRQMVRKIKNYREFLENNSNFDTEFLNIGDGVAISRKKAENL